MEVMSKPSVASRLRLAGQCLDGARLCAEHQAQQLMSAGTVEYFFVRNKWMDMLRLVPQTEHSRVPSLSNRTRSREQVYTR